MFITLIKPPLAMPIDSVTTQSGVPPIGLVYLSSYLKNKGHSVHVLDSIGEGIQTTYQLKDVKLIAKGLKIDQIISRIPKNTQLIGISMMFSNEWLFCKIVIEAIKKEFPNTPIVCGGEAATADAKYILNESNAVDYIIGGEGEEKINSLANCLERGGDLKEVNGLIWRDNEKIIYNPAGKRIVNIDELPWPDWASIPLENYLQQGLGQTTFGLRAIPILATRGCPYQCTFCSNVNMYGTNWFSRDYKDVVNEMQYYINNYNIEHFDFCDLTFVINKKWILNFCNEIISRDIKVSWGLPSGTRSEALTKEVLEKLYEAGLKRMNYAPESGSPTTLKNIKKAVNLDKMTESMRDAINAKIKIKATIIYGFPDQDWRQVRESLYFTIKLCLMGAHDIACFPFVPYPGSPLHDRLLKEGKIDKQKDDYDSWLSGNVFNKFTNMISFSDDISNIQLNILVIGNMAIFYILQFLIRPWRIIFILGSVIKRRPVTMLENLIYQKLLDIKNALRRQKKDYLTLGSR